MCGKYNFTVQSVMIKEGHLSWLGEGVVSDLTSMAEAYVHHEVGYLRGFGSLTDEAQPTVHNQMLHLKRKKIR